jgi:hypothetical protein
MKHLFGAESSERWKIEDRAGASSAAQVFRTMFGILSGPGASDGFRPWSHFSTPAGVTVICSMGLAGGPFTGGRMSSEDKSTDLNCWSRSLALLWLSLTR